MPEWANVKNIPVEVAPCAVHILDLPRHLHFILAEEDRACVRCGPWDARLPACGLDFRGELRDQLEGLPVQHHSLLPS